MPAVMIRQLDALAQIMAYTTAQAQRETLLAQAAMIQRSSIESVPKEADRRDVRRRYDKVEDAARIWNGDRSPLVQEAGRASRWDHQR